MVVILFKSHIPGIGRSLKQIYLAKWTDSTLLKSLQRAPYAYIVRNEVRTTAGMLFIAKFH